ncbi:MAG: polyprenol monophosphomannose synthase [Chitinophagales bacterium]|nr:polyprenol monophosphomannose synthase [Chitinophagales bacterium]
MSDSLIVIPTYKESENISRIIAAIFALPRSFHILVVDDNSPDGTADIVKNLINTTYPDSLFIEERKGKLGLGTAYIHGFRWALQHHYEYIFEMDADFSHPPADLLRLYDACQTNGADVAIGSRYVKGGGIQNWPLDRILLSKYASVYVRLVTWLPIHDTTAGFVCFRRRVLEAIDLDKIKFIGYAFQIEMKFAAWRLGFALREVPITFIDREYGESKMSTSIFKEAVLGVLKMKWHSFFNSYRRLSSTPNNNGSW